MEIEMKNNSLLNKNGQNKSESWRIGSDAYIVNKGLESNFKTKCHKNAIYINTGIPFLCKCLLKCHTKYRGIYFFIIYSIIDSIRH